MDHVRQSAQGTHAQAASSRTWRRRIMDEWLLLVFVLLALLLAWFDPQPPGVYRHWLQLPTLAGLTGLLVAIQGIGDSGLVQHAASALLLRMRSLRGVGLLLVGATTLLSTVLTNDVSLFLMVPLTLVIGGLCRLPVARMVVLEALAVNAGSTLSPIGNPQNLLLWQHAGINFPAFVAAMLPTAAIMCALVFTLAWVWLPAGRVELGARQLPPSPVHWPRATLAAGALLAMVAAMEFGVAPLGMAAVLAAFVLLARPSLRRTDWMLLLTFAAIFVALGHVATLTSVRDALDHLDFGQPLDAYVSGIVAAQLISNVPATVLLLDRVSDPMALAVAVNVGGFGVAIGSLANLIALRLARQPRALRLLHLASIPFLLVCAPLVYLAWRWSS